MTPTPLYSYRLSGRRPAMLLVLGVGAIMLATGYAYAAPWYFLAPAGFAMAMALWAVIANPQTGSTLTVDTLMFYNRGTPHIVHISDVVSMKITRWTDGPDTVALRLKSGTVVHVPSLCADSKHAVALRTTGVKEVTPR